MPSDNIHHLYKKKKKKVAPFLKNPPWVHYSYG